MNDEQNIKDKTLLEMERAELNLLVRRGFNFEVIVGKRTKKFEIYQPSLGVLDRISEIALDMVIDDNDFNNSESGIITKARLLIKDNAKRLSKVIAISVIGESYYTNIPILKHVMNILYGIRLRKLTDLFYHTITPSRLAELTAIITSISDIPDFLSSMRLLSGARTTKPRKESIEQKV